MRKLASIQRVLNVRPIIGADLIEAVDVLGWTVVTQKSNNFKVGDLVIYFEVDSFLNAEDPRFAPFEERFSNWGPKRGMRLKTIKLLKQVSQGLIMPVEEFHELCEKTRSGEYISFLEEGTDVTEILKIEKWEPFEEERSNNGGINKPPGEKKFPAFIRKTDQERVQNYINELGKHSAETFEVSIKLDGSSMTAFYVSKSSPYYTEIVEDQRKRAIQQAKGLKKLWMKLKAKLGIHPPAPDYFDGVCSRNIQLTSAGNHFTAHAEKIGLLEKLKANGMNIAVQGELIAPSIQENYEQVKDFEFYVFDIFDIDTQEYIKPRRVRAICADIGLNTVPIISEDVKVLDYDGEPRALVDHILAMAEGPGMNKGVKREGLVFKSNESDFSFKAISNSYLLKKEGKQAQ